MSLHVVFAVPTKARTKVSSVKLSTLGALASEVKTLGEGSFGADLSWAGCAYRATADGCPNLRPAKP